MFYLPPTSRAIPLAVCLLSGRCGRESPNIPNLRNGDTARANASVTLDVRDCSCVKTALPFLDMTGFYFLDLAFQELRGLSRDWKFAMLVAKFSKTLFDVKVCKPFIMKEPQLYPESYTALNPKPKTSQDELNLKPLLPDPTSTPQLPSNIPQIPTIKGHKASIKGPLGGAGTPNTLRP